MTTIAASASSEPKGLERILILACLMAGSVMVVVDSTIANVALPYMQGSTSASREQITWVLTSYVIAAAIMTAPVGWLSTRFGRKNLYIFSLAGFTIVSAMCGAAQSLQEIVLFRVLQGAIGAPLAPLSQSMMLDMYPPQDRAKAFALYGTGVMVGPILGPTIGGYLTDVFNWRWVFYINVPVGLAAVVGMLLYPSKGLRNPFSRFDWTGFSLVGLTLGAMQLMLDRGQDQGWFESGEIIIYAVIAGLGLYLSVVHLTLGENPFIPRALFKDRSFIGGFLGFIIVGQIMTASMAAIPPYLQTLGGYTVLDTGLIMSPRGLGTIIAMQIVGFASYRLDLRLIVVAGIVICFLTVGYMATWTPEVNLVTLSIVSVVHGFGMATLFTPFNLAAFATIPVELRTDATVIISLARNIGGAVGVAISSAIIAAQTQVARADLVAHVNPFNRALHLNGPGMMWNPAIPMTAAAIDGTVQRQAEIIAYSDNFLYLALIAAAGLLLLPLLRTPRTTQPVEMEGAHVE